MTTKTYTFSGVDTVRQTHTITVQAKNVTDAVRQWARIQNKPQVFGWSVKTKSGAKYPVTRERYGHAYDGH